MDNLAALLSEFEGATPETIRAALWKGGTATLANGDTDVVVTHGLGRTPQAHELAVHPIEAWGAATKWWVDTITATTFTIKVDQDPTQDVDFAWSAIG